MVCVVGRMRDLILQLSKSSIYSTKPYEINNAAIITFGNDLIEVIVYQFSFVISIRAEGEKIKHGLLVNFGKNIARQVSSLCASAMRVYPNEKHKPSRQLFHCIN